jgi:hypothetical protein
MIRLATKYDNEQIIKLMKCFKDESPMREFFPNNDESYWNLMLENIYAGAGAVFLEEQKGLLLSMVLPTIWSNKIFALHELAWYVHPTFRGGSTGYKLFKSYIEYGKKLKQEGRIAYFTMTKLISSPDIDYSKFGFKKTDENWIQ